MIFGLILFLVGLVLLSNLIYQWYTQGYKLQFIPWYVIVGLLLVILGIQTVLFTLVCEAFSPTENSKKK